MGYARMGVIGRAERSRLALKEHYDFVSLNTPEVLSARQSHV